MANEKLGWKDLAMFLSPAGQQQIVSFIQRAKAERGSNWLPEIKAEFPMFSWIAELVANRNAEEAFEDLQDAFPNYPLALVKPNILNLHERLAAEINKSR